EVAIRDALVTRGRFVRTAAECHLAAHELSVVLAHRTGRGSKAWIREVGARRPLPGDRVELAQHPRRAAPGRVLPLELGRQARVAPARVRVGFVVADMHDRFIWVERAPPAEREDAPAAGAV